MGVKAACWLGDAGVVRAFGGVVLAGVGLGGAVSCRVVGLGWDDSGGGAGQGGLAGG